MAALTGAVAGTGDGPRLRLTRQEVQGLRAAG
jgi:hypothetical protein